MRRKFYSLRGGFRPTPIRSFPTTSIRPIAKMNPSTLELAYKAYKSPLGQKLAGYAKTYAMNKLNSISNGNNVSSAFASNSLHAGKISTGAVTGQFGSVTRTRYRQGSKKTPVSIKRGGKNIMFYNGGIQVSGTISTQGVGNVAILDANMLHNITVAYGNLYNTNRVVGNYGRFYMASAYSEVKFTNSSNVGCSVDLYEIMPRETINGASPSTINGTPITAWNYALANIEKPQGIPVTTMANMSATTYGSVPFDSDIFTQFYVVKKRYEIELPASTTHIHEAQYNIQREFDDSQITNATTFGSIKNFTRWLMIVVRGNPVHGSDGSVGPSPMILDITYSLRFESYGLPGSSTVAGITTGFALPPSPQVYTTPTTEQTVVTG